MCAILETTSSAGARSCEGNGFCKQACPGDPITKSAIRQHYIDDGEVGLVLFCQQHCLASTAGNPTHLEAGADQNLLDDVGDHQFVFDDKNFPRGTEWTYPGFVEC